jgi:hypothetical protein
MRLWQRVPRARDERVLLTWHSAPARAPAPACARMRWLDDATVALDACAELARDYAGCGVAPRPGAFGLARPYGSQPPRDCCAAAAATEAAAPDAAEPARADEHADAAGGSARRRRKRKRREAPAAAELRALREDEALRCALRVRMSARRGCTRRVRGARSAHATAPRSRCPQAARGGASGAGARAGALRGAPGGAAGAGAGRRRRARCCRARG